MHQVRFVLFVAFCCVFVWLAVEYLGKGDVAAQGEVPLRLNERRTAASDLEVRVAAQEVAAQSGPRFVTRTALEALPQVGAIVRQSEDLSEMPKDGVAVRGVPLEGLRRALGVPATMVAEAVAVDGYATTYPAEYTKQHHPIFVLEMDGLTPSAWAEKTHTSDQGPYFIAYDSFVPAFHVLSHEDRQQVPTQVVRLEFATEERMFAGIRPAGAADLTVMQGYRIAQQNCFRCHDAAGYGGTGYGGTKAGRNWTLLAKDARERPEWFARWVHDPRAVDTKAEMPPNAKYDRATLTALTRYFATMK